MDIKGLGGIDLHITGTKKDPHGWGEFKFKNATVSFLDIYNLEINNGSGSLKFEDQNTKFESKKMKMLPSIDSKKYSEYIKKADLVICHGGVGTIFDAL